LRILARAGDALVSDTPLDRLRAAISQRMAEPSASVPERYQVPPAGGRHVLGDIQRIAEIWYGVKRARPVDSDERVPSPEALSASAADLNLDVHAIERDVLKLGERDLPCVMLARDGSSRLIMARPSADMFEIDGARGVEQVLASDLKAIQSGTIFTVSPRLAPGIGTSEKPQPRRALLELGSGWQVFRSVLSHMAESRRPLLVQLLLAAVLSNVLLIALPMFTMAVYDRVIPHAAFDTMWALAIGVMIALFADLAIRYVRLKLVDALGLSTSLAFQARLYRHLLRVKLKDGPRTAGGITNNMRDVDAICTLTPQLFVALAVDLPFFILLMVLLASIAGPAAFVPVVAILLLIAIHVLSHNDVERLTQEQAKLGRQQTNIVIETIGNLETVKATTAETKLLGGFERQADMSSHLTHQVRLWTGFSAQICAAVAQFALVGVVVMSVYQITSGAMTVGALAAATLIVGRALAPISQLIGYLDRLSQLSNAITTLGAFLNTPTEAAGDDSRRSAASIAGRIDLVDVRFAYPGEERPVLDGVTLRIAAGERVGIIGRVGGGKSTLLKLIPRFYEPSAGSLLVDGHDVRQFSPRELRRSIGLLRQDTSLFDDTLRENLTFGLDDLPQAVFDQAVRVSGVADFAARHPNGYGMSVGPRGERLSGGERQAVALARALMGQPRILIMDEPTAAMDSAFEARVTRDLAAATQGMTVVIATHRMPVLALVDRIVVLDHGKVIADGPKNEILRKLGAAA
jgi:ATP-binding cassette, subfamily C, bacterial LapB